MNNRNGIRILDRRPPLRSVPGRPRPFVRDESWRDQESERGPKTVVRGRKKRELPTYRPEPMSVIWEEHRSILAKAGINIDEAPNRRGKRY